MTTADEIGGRELTFEHGILQVIPEPPHGPKDLSKAVVVADVVAHKKRVAHALTPCCHA